MKLASLLLAAALLAPVCQAADTPAAAPMVTAAPTQSDLLAKKLLQLAGTKALLQQGFETGIKPALDGMRAQGMPADLIDSIRAESQRFFTENFKWEDVEPQLVHMYATAFTESELRDLVAFYETPTGRKASAQLPMLMQEGVSLGMTRIRANMPAFQQRVGALIQNYKKKAAEDAQAAQLPANPAPSPTAAPHSQ
jgi:hypothetical protein